MMYPPIFQVCAASAPVTVLLGNSPTRLYPFGEASQDTRLPYAVWQTVSGHPENYLGQRPDINDYVIQVDVYAASVTDSRSVAEALRSAIEGHAHIVSWRGESRDNQTNHYRFSFDVEWWVQQ